MKDPRNTCDRGRGIRKRQLHVIVMSIRGGISKQFTSQVSEPELAKWLLNALLAQFHIMVPEEAGKQTKSSYYRQEMKI